MKRGRTPSSPVIDEKGLKFDVVFLAKLSESVSTTIGVSSGARMSDGVLRDFLLASFFNRYPV